MREHIHGIHISKKFADSSPQKVTVRCIFCTVPEKSFGMLLSSANSPFFCNGFSLSLPAAIYLCPLRPLSSHLIYKFICTTVTPKKQEKILNFADF